MVYTMYATVTALDRMLAPTAPNSMLQLLYPITRHSTTEWLEHITGWTANRCCSILYVKVSAYAAATECNEEASATRQGCMQTIS